MINFRTLILAVLIYGTSSAVLAKDWNKKKTDDPVKLTKSQEIMSFDITISGSILENLKRLPFEFDFSKHNIWTEMHQVDCSF